MMNTNHNFYQTLNPPKKLTLKGLMNGFNPNMKSFNNLSTTSQVIDDHWKKMYDSNAISESIISLNLNFYFFIN